MLYYIPLEEYKTRYTADWVQQYEREFKRLGVRFKTIFGKSLSSSVSDGGVLNAAGTGYYKSVQLSKVLELISQNKITESDIIFFADLWFPGIENLFYARNLLKLNFKICGILHAGTYDKHDFTVREGMTGWGRFMEKAILAGADTVYVATNFHKNLICGTFKKDFPELDKKIIVTGLPFYADELRRKYKNNKKKDIVVFPHRIAPEKHPELFDKLSIKYPKFRFVKCCEVCKDRKQYFELLAQSKFMVSFAEQETFGYATLEAMALGCCVLVPNKLSYTETVPDGYRYDNLKDFYRVFDKFLKTAYRAPVYRGIDVWEKSIENMIKDMEARYGL